MEIDRNPFSIPHYLNCGCLDTLKGVLARFDRVTSKLHSILRTRKGNFETSRSVMLLFRWYRQFREWLSLLSSNWDAESVHSSFHRHRTNDSLLQIATFWLPRNSVCCSDHLLHDPAIHFSHHSSEHAMQWVHQWHKEHLSTYLTIMIKT
jgi:hypothetical protein